MQRETASMNTGRPLLTIAIPTYNRSEDLAGLLEVLEPQLAEFPQVEVLVSDNASTDDTPRARSESGGEGGSAD